MTDTTRALLAASYPAVTIERRTGNDGWPCWRVSLALPRHIVPIGHDCSTHAEALAEAHEVVASLPQPCRIVDMTQESGA